MNARTVLSMHSKPVVARGSAAAVCNVLRFSRHGYVVREETLRLIEIWGDDRIQAQLGVHRNQVSFYKNYQRNERIWVRENISTV